MPNLSLWVSEEVSEAVNSVSAATEQKPSKWGASVIEKALREEGYLANDGDEKSLFDEVKSAIAGGIDVRALLSEAAEKQCLEGVES